MIENFFRLQLFSDRYNPSSNTTPGTSNLNGTSPKNPKQKIETLGCIQADTVYQSLSLAAAD